MQRLPVKNHLVNVFYQLKDHKAFTAGLQHAIDQIKGGGVFIGDNLVTFAKTLGFLHDEAFMAAFEARAETAAEKATLWRVYTLCWAAKRALAIPGDFVECACYKGTTARIVADYVDWRASGKAYFLYDLFEHPEDASHHDMPDHGAALYDQVRRRFADLPNVRVTRGAVPAVLERVAPETIALLHLDLNGAAAELGALGLLWDRVSPGAAVLLDDYGWMHYQDQKLAEDAFFAERGYSVLELPTGQGLVIK